VRRSRAKRAAERLAKTEALRGKARALRARLEARRGRRPRPRRNERRGWVLLGLILVLLLLMHPCRCNEEPVHEPPVCEDECPGSPAEPEPTPPAPLTGRLSRQDRPAFQGAAPDSPSWIDAFRLQVAARGPRLAECFIGADRPGRLKWTSSVEPLSGGVSEHVFEPMLITQELSRTERACIEGVLSSPTYTLEAGSEPSTPSRVGLVIEF